MIGPGERRDHARRGAHRWGCARRPCTTQRTGRVDIGGKPW